MQLINTVFTFLAIAMTASAAPTGATVLEARTPPPVSQCSQDQTTICCVSLLGIPVSCNIISSCGATAFCCDNDSNTVNVRSTLALLSERILTSHVTRLSKGSSLSTMSSTPATSSASARLQDETRDLSVLSAGVMVGSNDGRETMEGCDVVLAVFCLPSPLLPLA
ncbi:hypothetical protein B0T14DRAFT_527290 [Immersiella caudata]|uniref:Hydrophobin n=1 Tax=Immersiella caudata TaxID=314043 RepID=A0AA40BUA9_9PEZI|nr:hypothetical protein B0T14DRAFT_527290 [Immersiella caudata]